MIDKINEMGRIIRIATAIKLSAVPSENEQFDDSVKGVDTFGETARFTNQAFEVMAQFSIHALDTIGFTFVGHRRMGSRGIDQRLIGGKQIAEIPNRLWSSI